MSFIWRGELRRSLFTLLNKDRAKASKVGQKCFPSSPSCLPSPEAIRCWVVYFPFHVEILYPDCLQSFCYPSQISSIMGGQIGCRSLSFLGPFWLLPRPKNLRSVSRGGSRAQPRWQMTSSHFLSHGKDIMNYTRDPCPSMDTQCTIFLCVSDSLHLKKGGRSRRVDRLPRLVQNF